MSARRVGWVLCLLTCGLIETMAQAEAPGGWVEKDASGVRMKYTATQIQSFLPATRGALTFPAPYGTQGARLTDATDCVGGDDCLMPVGYAYWRNSNNHVGSDDMYIFLSFDRRKGGTGPTLFRYNKVQGTVVKMGPLFDQTSKFALKSGEGWYFSATQPTKLYLTDGPALLRYDVLSKHFETVYDVSGMWGNDKWLWQNHSSNDDSVHSATLRIQSTGEMLGCLVYHERTHHLAFFGKIGVFNECQVDKSGHWLVSMEDLDGRSGDDMRVFDLANDTEVGRVYAHEGGVGHADTGYGYIVGNDEFNSLPHATIIWYFGPTLTKGPVVHYNVNWNIESMNYVSHSNAKPDVPLDRQYACGSDAENVSQVQNEITCVRLDGSTDRLIVAPVMTNMETPGGQTDYGKRPKGNLDISGQYFIWTTNLSGSRLEAFLVKVPSQLLID